MSFLFTKSPGTVLARPPSRNTSRQYLPARYNEALCFQPAAVRPSLSHNMKKGFHALKGMAKNLQHYPVFHTHTCAALQPTPCNGTPDAPPPQSPSPLHSSPLLSHYSFKNSRQRAEC